MPGIFGIIGGGRHEKSPGSVELGASCMKHEPDYLAGVAAFENPRLRVGWTAHQRSFSARMPAWNETRDVCLIFSGEDFTEPCEIELLRAKGHECTSGDAGYLVHLYEEKGARFLEKLNGWFSGLLVDFRNGQIILFNDRYGLGRIYYHQSKEGFYFSSEAKWLLAILPEVRQLDYTCLAQTFSCGCVLGNRTLFSSINLLPPGSRWVFDSLEGPKKQTYFTASQWEHQDPLGPEAYYTAFRDTFSRILPRYLRGGRPLAMSLTGGLDGRMIMSRVARASIKLPCYTFAGPYRDCMDVKIARRIARACGQSHETISVGPSFFARFPELAEKSVFISDGAMDVSGAVELHANRLAARLAPVRLTGNYGSEIVRRNVAFKPWSTCEAMLDPEFAGLVAKSSVIYEAERGGHELTFIAFKQTPWHHYGRLSVEQSCLTMRSPFLDNDLVALAYRAPSSLVDSADVSLRLIAEGSERLGKIPTDRGLCFRPLPLVCDLLHFYREFTYKAEYAYDYGMPQWLAKVDHLLTGLHLERLFLGRQKFYHFRLWYRKELSGYIKDVLLDPVSLGRGYLKGRRIEQIVAEHINGNANYTTQIHQLLTAELIHRYLLESI
ncbi:MAG: asparagine synthase-related protein [Syntrophobacteraceae bacterium]